MGSERPAGDPASTPEHDVGRPAAIATLRAAGASFALVFGSRARGDHRPTSDLDIAAWWPADTPAPWSLELPAQVDLVVLNGAPIEIAGRIALEGEVLFDDDPAARVRWTADTRKIWLDERPRFERAHREFLEATTRGR
ncbi:MAG: nucleotidyltransferase domain-containing protein [Nocardiopsis sp. BM-2018]|nr:MAG: nucleotidyltransferase domain-containing protein [Nocardiopsis sp. BM-2018]